MPLNRSCFRERVRASVSWIISSAVIMIVLTVALLFSSNPYAIIGIVVMWSVFLLVSLIMILESLIRCWK